MTLDMTLEEAGRKALYAAGAGDLEGLRAALQARGRAIEELRSALPAEDLRARLLKAHEIGEAIAQHIRRFRLRTGIDIAHLAGAGTRISSGSSDPCSCVDVRL